MSGKTQSEGETRSGNSQGNTRKKWKFQPTPGKVGLERFFERFGEMQLFRNYSLSMGSIIFLCNIRTGVALVIASENYCLSRQCIKALKYQWEKRVKIRCDVEKYRLKETLNCDNSFEVSLGRIIFGAAETYLKRHFSVRRTFHPAP